LVNNMSEKKIKNTLKDVNIGGSYTGGDSNYQENSSTKKKSNTLRNGIIIAVITGVFGIIIAIITASLK
jgi:hypothetical protein